MLLELYNLFLELPKIDFGICSFDSYKQNNNEVAQKMGLIAITVNPF